MAITNNVLPDNWKYCSINENPADIITKIKMCDISMVGGTPFLKKHCRV